MQKSKQPTGNSTGEGKVWSVRGLLDEWEVNRSAFEGKLSLQGRVSSVSPDDYDNPSSVSFSLKQGNYRPSLQDSEENDPSSVFCYLSDYGIEKLKKIQKEKERAEGKKLPVAISCMNRIKITGTATDIGNEPVIRVDDFEEYAEPRTGKADDSKESNGVTRSKEMPLHDLVLAVKGGSELLEGLTVKTAGYAHLIGENEGTGYFYISEDKNGYVPRDRKEKVKNAVRCKFTREGTMDFDRVYDELKHPGMVAVTGRVKVLLTDNIVIHVKEFEKREPEAGEAETSETADLDT